MKGVILCAGKGTRLKELTKAIPKCLLPVYDKPMIYYSIEKLAQAGIKDIIIIPNYDNEKLFRKALGNGDKFGVNLSYVVQYKTEGPVVALSLVKGCFYKKNIALLFGDNIFQDSLETVVKNFNGGAHVFLKKVNDPERFGIAELSKGKILSLEEKPEHPKSDYAVAGVYLYDSKVFDHIKNLKPASNGELGITDLNKVYLNNDELNFNVLQGYWVDAGTPDGLCSAGILSKVYRP